MLREVRTARLTQADCWNDGDDAPIVLHEKRRRRLFEIAENIGNVVLRSNRGVWAQASSPLSDDAADLFDFAVSSDPESA